MKNLKRFLDKQRSRYRACRVVAMDHADAGAQP